MVEGGQIFPLLHLQPRYVVPPPRILHTLTFPNNSVAPSIIYSLKKITQPLLELSLVPIRLLQMQPPNSSVVGVEEGSAFRERPFVSIVPCALAFVSRSPPHPTQPRLANPLTSREKMKSNTSPGNGLNLNQTADLRPGSGHSWDVTGAPHWLSRERKEQRRRSWNALGRRSLAPALSCVQR